MYLKFLCTWSCQATYSDSATRWRDQTSPSRYLKHLVKHKDVSKNHLVMCR